MGGRSGEDSVLRLRAARSQGDWRLRAYVSLGLFVPRAGVTAGLPVAEALTKHLATWECPVLQACLKGALLMTF